MANYIERTQVVDLLSGEIVSDSAKNKWTYENEPVYLKKYEWFPGKAEMAKMPAGFADGIGQLMSFSNNGEPMTVALDMTNKERIAKLCGVGAEQIRRYIIKAIECGVLFRTKIRKEYEVNPFYMSKGRWGSVRELRKRFRWDAASGRWTRREGMEGEQEDGVRADRGEQPLGA